MATHLTRQTTARFVRRVHSGTTVTARLHTVRTSVRGLSTASTGTASSASSTSRIGLGVAVIAGAAGGALLVAGLTLGDTPLAAAEASQSPSASAPAPSPPVLQSGSKLAAYPPAKKKSSSSSPPNVSDLYTVDFRTIGACPCPPLPNRAPQWLHEQARDETFQYRDLGEVLDTTGHLLYDGLGGDRRLSEVYYFCEKIVPEVPAGGDAHGAHTQPNLPPSLDFEPQTPGGSASKSVTAAPSTSWSSFLPSFLRPSTASAESTAPASAPRARSSGSQKALEANAAHQTPIGPEVRAVFHVGTALCGHRGIVHGGMTAALMDEVSGAATFCSTGPGSFTANLNINYLQPVRADQYVLVRAQAVKQQGRKTYVNIAVEDGTGGVYARGTALFVQPKQMPAAVLVASTQ